MRTRTLEEKEREIREWFSRHRKDYCRHDEAAPPLAWSEYFQWLLDRLQEAKGRTMLTNAPMSDEPVDDLQYVLLPSGSVVHQNGVPVRLITGALVTVAYGNMSELVGHHLGPVPCAPEAPSPASAAQEDPR